MRPPTSPPSPRRRPRALAPACLALCLALSLPQAAAGADGDPQNGQEGSAPSGTEEGDARQEEAEKDQAKAPPPPAKPRVTPRPAGRPGRKPAPAAPPAPAATPAPLRFTDEDLERFHNKPPASDEPGEETADDEGAAGMPSIPPGASPSATPPSGGPPPAPRAKRPAARPTPAPAQPPGTDPLMALKERERRQAMRAEQLRSLRDRVAQVQARLDFLRAKRLAIVNPFYPMPEGGGEEQKRDASLKPKEMLEQVDREIQGTEEDLAEAREDLIDFETRFAAELGAP